MRLYNIYFGTIGKKLGCKYRFSAYCKSEESAKELTKKSAESFYYKNEGKFGIPTYNQIAKESDITGLNIEVLYKDHIDDMMRFYVIPYDLDTISSKDIKY